MTNKALIIIDMLNDFIDPEGTLYCGETAPVIVPHIKNLLAQARQAGDHVIFLQDSHDPDDLEFKKFPPHCVTGTWGSQIVTELTPFAGEQVIPKKRYSGFFETNLEQVLAAADIKKVTVVGVCTSICVMDTVGGLANRDYKTVVPEAGVADFDPDMHKMALRRLRDIYGAEII